MTAYEIYRVRTALKEREMVAEQAWQELKACNDPEKGAELVEAEERYLAAKETRRMYDEGWKSL